MIFKSIWVQWTLLIMGAFWMGRPDLKASQPLQEGDGIPSSPRTFSQPPGGFLFLQGTLQGKSLFFQTKPLEAGTLGFMDPSLMGKKLTTRRAVAELLKNQEDSHLRALALSEIMQAWSNETWSDDLQNDVEGILVRDAYKAAQATLKKVLIHLNKAPVQEDQEVKPLILSFKKDQQQKLVLKAEQTLQKKEDKVRAYCQKPEVFSAYVQHCFQVYSGSGPIPLVDSLAYLTRTRVYVWQPLTQSPDILEVLHLSPSEGCHQVLHFLHSPHQPYRLLETVSKTHLLQSLHQRFNSMIQENQRLMQANQRFEAEKAAVAQKAQEAKADKEKEDRRLEADQKARLSTTLSNQLEAKTYNFADVSLSKEKKTQLLGVAKTQVNLSKITVFTTEAEVRRSNLRSAVGYIENMILNSDRTYTLKLKMLIGGTFIDRTYTGNLPSSITLK